MGMDITMMIVKDNDYLATDIFEGRNTEWFNNMMGRGNNELYNHLPIQAGNSPQTTKTWADYYGSEDYADSYFGVTYVNVGDYKKWFEEFKPNVDAGWTTTYEAWEYKKRGIEPELYHYLPDDANRHDMVFMEIESKYDCSKWLYDYLLEHKIPDDADIQYCFDN